MLLFRRALRVEDPSPGILLLFGVGLIGRSVRSALAEEGGWIEERLPFSWEPGGRQREDADGVGRRVAALLGGAGRPGDPAAVAVLWSAGSCGFGATTADAEVEAEGFRSVLGIAGGVAPCRISFHLVSSAGGLFEGRHRIEEGTPPLPCRPYGELKIRQEALLRERGSAWDVTIYRASSVYGPVRPGARMGLLPTLIVNALQGRSTAIVGAWSTLRDYVYAEDLGRYLARRAGRPWAGEEARTLVLASGRATSIHGVHRIAEGVLGKRVPVHFLPQAWNASDITVAPGVLPPDWRTRDLESGARAVLRDWREGGAERADSG